VKADGNSMRGGGSVPLLVQAAAESPIGKSDPRHSQNDAIQAAPADGAGRIVRRTSIHQVLRRSNMA